MPYQINVSTQEIRDTANFISQRNIKLADILSESIQLVKKVAGVSWVSEAADETLKKIESYNKPMAQFKEEIDKYVKFLNEAAQNIESTEDTNKRNTAEKEFKDVT